MARADDKTHPSVSAAEAGALFRGLETAPGLVLAVSGGPDSTALMWLAARWHRALRPRDKPALLAVTVDHGLRRESAGEARAVARLAKQLGVPHRTLRWTGRKPSTGVPEAARIARYALLAQAAHTAGATHVLTAHTRDDQAETVLMRLARGSGLTGLGAMAMLTGLAAPGATPLLLARPLLGLPKARLIATLDAARVAYADDPTNRDPRYTRPRLRDLMTALEREGLGAQRLALLAHRLRRADQAVEIAVDAAQVAVSMRPWTAGIAFDAPLFDRLPAEVALRLMGRAVAFAGDEGPVELGKLEALLAAVAGRDGALRRTLAGALITCRDGQIGVETAPARQKTRAFRPKRPLTKPGRGNGARPQSR
ncbi:MAG TPA: tRNA lysidine(34) synthetase TilS [Pseudolabrys sp.]